MEITRGKEVDRGRGNNTSVWTLAIHSYGSRFLKKSPLSGAEKHPDFSD